MLITKRVHLTVTCDRQQYRAKMRVRR